MTDVEKGERTPLIAADVKVLRALGSRREHVPIKDNSDLVEIPVGGLQGNPSFRPAVEISLRVTTIAMLLGSLVWLPEATGALGLGRFSRHAPLAVCLTIFFTGPTAGSVMNAASAGVQGCLLACVNTFLLRGFIPEGVEPGMGLTSRASIVGWLDLMVFNLIVLAMNCRMGFRMTAMALNVSFMMSFLNPEDKTVFSKNFQINPEGAAVSAFLGTCLGSAGALAAVFLPYPLAWSTSKMKSGGKTASDDMCKLFIAAVRYFKDTQPSVLIERQVGESECLKKEIAALEQHIGDAYVETLDIGRQGTIRALYEKHAVMLGDMFDILSALQIALSTEDFGPSHKTCMDCIGESSHDLVDAACLLLVEVTTASEDGDIEDAEKAALLANEEKVKKAMRAMSVAFDGVRRDFGKPVCKELMNESFFVFCLSAFARLVLEYSETVRLHPPAGQLFSGVISNSIKEVVTFPVWYHHRVVSRYWLSIMLCLVFAVAIDDYSPSCAITSVFLINTRVGPDVMAMISGLLAVVVGVVANALMYSFSCKFGNTSVLMMVSCLWWLSTIFVAHGGSSLAGIGLWMAALAPFAILKTCSDMSEAATASAAVGLWSGIRALLIAVTITILSEVVHCPGLFTRMGTEALDDAFEAMQEAFKAVWPDGKAGKDAKQKVSKALDVVSSSLVNAETYNSAAKMEPRLWKCTWKGSFLLETSAQLRKLRLDILLVKKAMCGIDGKMEIIQEMFDRVPEYRKLKKDVDSTMEDARELTKAVLEHEFGEFAGFGKLDQVEGLYDLEGYDEALESQCKLLNFPAQAPDSMEGDQLVQISIVFVMLAYLVKHVADITRAAVKLA